MASKKPSLAGDGLGLFTDFVQGVRKGLKLAGGTDKQLEALREEHIIATVVRLILSMTVWPVALEFLDRTISVTMDLAKTTAQLIADGEYGWVNPNIAQHFSFGTGDGTRTTEIHLLYYNKRMTSDQIIADMERQGLRPATFLELLWVCIRHPGLQFEFPIVALGTVVKIKGYHAVAYLYRDFHSRDLNLSLFDDMWPTCYRFAAVRLPTQTGK